MQQTARTTRMGAFVTQVFFSPDDLLAEIQATLAALASLECRYERDKERLEQRSELDSAARQDVLIECDKRHRQEREPYVRRLHELEDRMRASITANL